MEISEAEIDRVVRAFYARVREDAVLGPIFCQSLGRSAEVWRAHEAKIGRFWRNALLRQPVYQGNPMLVHAGTSAIEAHHFAHWLDLFEEVLADELSPPLAQSWARLARRIGKGLSLGLTAARQRQGAVPSLRDDQPFA